MIIGAVVSFFIAAITGWFLLSRADIEDRTEIVAHRGASGSAPENTMAAIEQAIAAGDPIPQPDMTSHKWIPLTDVDYGIDFGIGISAVPPEVLREARLSRWLKVDPLRGPFANVNFHPILAGL